MDRICVALDVEATGMQPDIDEIIEVAAVKFRDTEVLATYTQLVCPHQAVPLKTQRLTGISTADLEDAPRFREIGAEFAAFVGKHPIIGHSVDFDLGMLRAQGMSFAQPVYDTFELATLLLPQASVYSLTALASYLGLEYPDAHRALNDADMSRQVLLALVARIEQMPLNELAALNRLMTQTDWASRELFADILRMRAGKAWQELAPSPEQANFWQPRTPTATESQPLKPTGNSEPLDSAQVAAFFANDGPLSQQFTHYEQRPQQVAMAEATTATLNQGDVLLVEAGTGTGKSMAYLIPTALFALQRGERVVVSTNTINLQDQLFRKDIPDVQRMLEETGAGELHAALLKGRSNYLCLRRYHELRKEERLAPHEARALLKVQLWLPTTESGDRAELLLMQREQAAWGKLNVPLDSCTGPRCAFFRECYFFQARRRAEAAHMVVVNHALLLADLAAQANIIPPYEHLVVDEAHNLEDAATDQLGFQIDQTGLLALLDGLYQTGGAQAVGGLLSDYRTSLLDGTIAQDKLDKADKLAAEMAPLVDEARRSVQSCFARLRAFAGQQARTQHQYDTRLRLTPQLRAQPDWAEVELAWSNLSLALNALGTSLGSFETLLRTLEDAEVPDYDALVMRVEWLNRELTDVRIHLGHLVLGDDNAISWLQHDQQSDGLMLHAVPLSVAEILQVQLFAEKQSSILTSATLAIDESFAFVAERLGLAAPVVPTELRLDSPFNYERQVVLYLPDDIPEPNQRGYQQMIEEAILQLAPVSAGRMLVLFTSNSALRQAHAALQEPLEAHDITLLGQGLDGSRRVLLERFKEWPRTVLLGTTSFWEGVDVVGDALSVLVIAKLPFHVPSDPVFAARSEQCSEPFLDYAVPQSILRFKQGFGRLIRSRTDRGIVLVLDKRLLSKRYGQQFLQSLPSTSVRTGALKNAPALAARMLQEQPTR